ncbi:MAG: hypothetical protein FWC57_03650 [Endomicrobia bacterium]|nr:hypothetical protein [Endomicrobiia bacterium]
MKRIYLFLSLFFLSFPALADEIKKDTDFFTNDCQTSFPAIKVNRFDNVNEFFVKNTGLLCEIDYDNYVQTVNPFDVPTIGYTSSGSSNRDDGLKISRDMNNDIYLAGNPGVGPYDVIKKYTNSIEQWSIAPSTSTTSTIVANGLILSKNNNFLYAIYNNDGNPLPATTKREIYKINKQTGAYSVIYSTPRATVSQACLPISYVVDENDDSIYLLSATDNKKLILQKINSSGVQVFQREFTGTSGQYIYADKMMFLNNGLIFIRGVDGFLANGQRSQCNDIIALVDKQGNIVSNFIINNTLAPSGQTGQIDYIFAGADEYCIYYICQSIYDSSNPLRQTENGACKVLLYNYQNQLIKTLYLPGRTNNANYQYPFFTYDHFNSYDQHTNPLYEAFVKNKKLCVPFSYDTNTGMKYSYNVDLNNPLISLKYSEDQNFIDKTSNPTYISQKSQNITFRVKYKNFRAKAPALLRVHIYADGVSIASSPFSLSAINPSDIDYAKGVDYSVAVPMICSANTAYTYQFELTDGVSLFNSDTYTLPNYLPGKPVAVSPNAHGEKVSYVNVPLEWSCGTSSVTYTLQIAGPYDVPSSVYSWTTAYSGSSPTYSLAQLETGKYYYWKVSAANFSGVSEESDVFFFKAFDIPIPPKRVSPNEKVEIIGNSNIRIEWYCPTRNVTYSLKMAGPYYSPTNAYMWREAYSGSRNYYNAPFLEAGKYYYWKVSAANFEGDSAESEIFSFNITKLSGQKAFNAPNPFNPAKGQRTQFVFNMPESGTAKIIIYSEYGDKVWESETVSASSAQGSAIITYDGRDNSGKMLYNGSYLAVITKKYGGKTSMERVRILIVK